MVLIVSVSDLPQFVFARVSNLVRTGYPFTGLEGEKKNYVMVMISI